MIYHEHEIERIARVAGKLMIDPHLFSFITPGRTGRLNVQIRGEKK